MNWHGGSSPDLIMSLIRLALIALTMLAIGAHMVTQDPYVQ